MCGWIHRQTQRAVTLFEQPWSKPEGPLADNKRLAQVFEHLAERPMDICDSPPMGYEPSEVKFWRCWNTALYASLTR